MVFVFEKLQNARVRALIKLKAIKGTTKVLCEKRDKEVKSAFRDHHRRDKVKQYGFIES